METQSTGRLSDAAPYSLIQGYVHMRVAPIAKYVTAGFLYIDFEIDNMIMFSALSYD